MTLTFVNICTMNNIKLVFLLIFLAVSTMLAGQSETATPSLQRVIVIENSQAIVAVLDEEGFVLKKIMDVPSYFNERHKDEHYITASYTSLSDAQLNKELMENSLSIKSLTSSKLRPSEI